MKARRVTGGARGLIFDALDVAHEDGSFGDDIGLPDQVYRRTARGQDQAVIAAGVLSYAKHVQVEAAELIDEAVALARINGATWKHIGECLGISQQAASARFGSKVGR